MAYKPTIQSTTQLNTTGSTGTNLGSTLFITEGFFTKDRTINYSSMSEVRNDNNVATNSEVYRAALTAFSQTGAAVPFYIGRRLANNVTYTPTAQDLAEYTFGLEVFLKEDPYNDFESYTISITSDSDATVEEIATALYTEIATTQSIPNLTVEDNTGSITITPAATYSFVLSNESSNLQATFTTTESAADVLSAINEEIQEDYYFVTASDHTEEFILAMADEIEATASGDYPKQYRVCVQDTGSITPLLDPATDILGKLAEGGYYRTHGEWNHEADDIYPEVAATVYNGQFFPGSTTWKFMTNEAVVGSARDPITGKLLSTAKQGYIRDRNASWVGTERGVSFMHGGTMAVGTSAWIDVVRAADWINDTIETRLLNLFVNQSGDKISFLSSDQQLVLGTINKVLDEAVSRKILSGYDAATVTVAPSFADQVIRTLDDIEWTGYLAGAIHFVIVDGSLTYADEALA